MRPFRGRVFSDADTQCRGIEGVPVSDGLHVVRSDAEGCFELPGHDSARFISVHQPPDFAASCHFIRTDAAVASYDFAMRPKQRREHFSFVHISDTETAEMGDWLDELKDFVRDSQPAFIFHTGDLCYAGGIDWHSRNFTSATMGTPVYTSLGNHDLLAGDYGEQFFETRFGPVNYSFEEGNVLFVVTPMNHGDFEPSYSQARIFTWLQNLLALFPQKQPKIIFNHDLLTNGLNFDFSDGDDHSGSVIELSSCNLKAWLYGHWHSHFHKRHSPDGPISLGTAVVAKGGIDHSPAAFRVVDVDAEGDVRTQLRCSYVHRHITVVSPRQDHLPRGADGAFTVSVNAYHTPSPTVAVRCRIHSDTGWFDLKPRSAWNWSATWLPQDTTNTTTYTLTTEARLANGRTLTAHVEFILTTAADPGTDTTDPDVATEWPNLLGNTGHDGGAARALPPPLHLHWVHNVGASIFMASPVVAQGRVFTATIDDGNAEDCAIIACDAVTGQQIWRYPTRNSVKNTIVYAAGTVIATDLHGFTYAVDAATGALRWQKDLQYDRLPGFVSGLVTDGESVFTGFGHSLQALAVTDGSTLWRNSAWDGGEGSTPTMTLGAGVLVASSHWRGLYGHDAATGELLWQHTEHGLRFRDGTVTYRDNLFFLAAQDSLFILDPRSGAIEQQRQADGSFHAASAPLITNDLFIVGTADKGVAAFSRDTLEPLWDHPTGKALSYTVPYACSGAAAVETSPVLAGDTIYFAASDGIFRGIDVHTGTGRWQMDLGAPVFTTAAISGELLFLADFSGNLYAFRQGG
ncbi:MAG: phosphoesterase [Gemmatimonadaceae bacterium]|nr:phosphoesterase [Gemmatimonadaceae bacterium]